MSVFVVRQLSWLDLSAGSAHISCRFGLFLGLVSVVIAGNALGTDIAEFLAKRRMTQFLKYSKNNGLGAKRELTLTPGQKSEFLVTDDGALGVEQGAERTGISWP